MRAIKKVGVFDSTETITGTVPIAEMVIDDYQGHVNKNVVQKIAAKWDLAAAGAVILNMRDTQPITYAVLDGQHRVLAAKQIGVSELNALVYVGKTKEQEAALFVKLNTKHNVGAIDRFRANLAAGEIREKTIRAACREVGLDISLNHQIKMDHLTCAAALVNIYDKYGIPALKTVLGALTSAFREYPDRHKAYTQTAMIGTAQFFYRYPDVDMKRVIDRLRTKSPTVLTAMAEAKADTRHDFWVGWGKVIVSLYNDGLKASAKLDHTLMDRVKYTPAGLKKIHSEEVRKKKLASLAKAQENPEYVKKRRAALERAWAANRLRNEAKKKENLRVVTTLNNGRKPLKTTLAAAAKTVPNKKR